MNHKRHRPKSARGGCFMCRPHKGSGSVPRRRDLRAPTIDSFDATRREVDPECDPGDPLDLDVCRWCGRDWRECLGVDCPDPWDYDQGPLRVPLLEAARVS